MFCRVIREPQATIEAPSNMFLFNNFLHKFETGKLYGNLNANMFPFIVLDESLKENRRNIISHYKSRFNLDCKFFDKAGVLGFDIFWILFGDKNPAPFFSSGTPGSLH